ncbi:MAG: hypothetical protein LBD20_05445 [Spirochaetaceae bacterium]|jgi:hypothetical protein|nr:hypothetical protein [Spirochaetaceae bacterium]
MPTTFTPFQQCIIDSLIALHEGRELPRLWQNHFKAFDGVYDAETPFFLNMPYANTLLLYYNPSWLPEQNLSRPEFKKIAEKIKHELLDISNFIIFLEDNGLLDIECKRLRFMEIPLEERRKWRCYREFHTNESAPILHVKSISPTPNDDFYKIYHGLRLSIAG